MSTLKIFVRYGELALKSPPVRRQLEKYLVRNIRRILRNNGIFNTDISNERSWGRLVIYLWNLSESDTEEINRILDILSKYVCGITSISLVSESSSDLEEMKIKAVNYIEKRISPGSSFVVRARRIGKHDYRSIDVEREVGAAIFLTLSEKMNLSVNLTDPDFTLFIEIKDDKAFIFDHKIQGIGGFPQGAHKKIASILRGSMEDAIASFLLCKRGAFAIPIIFEKESDKFSSNKENLERQLEVFSHFQPLQKHSYYKVNFTELLEQIGYSKIKCSDCDKLCIAISEKIISKTTDLGITLGNSDDTILVRNPEKSFSGNFIPVYYPIIALNPETLYNPFEDNTKEFFCLDDCPGLNNQKKKEIKPLSSDEISELVASANIAYVHYKT